MNQSLTPSLSFQATLVKARSNPLITWIFFIGFAGQALRNLVDWTGYGIITGLALATLFWTYRSVFLQQGRKYTTPLLLLGYVGLALSSVIWSAYRLETLLGASILFITFLTGWVMLNAAEIPTILLSLYSALKWIVGLSFAFELWLAVILKHGILPLSMQDLKPGTYPPSFEWSYGILLQGGPIQGIVGNRNLLGFIALLLIVLAAGLAFRGYISGVAGFLWILVGIGVNALTRSATIEASLFAVLFVLLAVLVLKVVRPAMKYTLYFVLTVGTGVFLILLGTFSSYFFALLDRSPDMTNRFFIWGKVARLALERPEGWGWIGYWAPWVYPFKDYIRVDGAVQLHAHNALIDIWLQLGILGVIIAVCIAVLACVQAWRKAVHSEAGQGLELTMLLLLAALLLQSVAESRLLIEGNWLLFSIIIIWCNRSLESRKQG